jgi:hypothetical protein
MCVYMLCVFIREKLNNLIVSDQKALGIALMPFPCKISNTYDL